MLAKNTETKEDNIGIEDDDTLCIETCELIAPMTRIRGKFKLSTRSITFVPDQNQVREHGNSRYIDLALNPPPLLHKKVETKTLNSLNYQQKEKKKSGNLSKKEEEKEEKEEKNSRNEYWIAINVCSSYQQVGGTRYRLQNAHHFWLISELREIYFRRYELRKCAFELFFYDDSSWFFTFSDEGRRNGIFNKIISLNASLNKKVKKSLREIQQKWIRREMSNFEYLMRLNIFAGRSFNDLTQYPVVPWVITDFASSELDLQNVAIYRDLSKPIGALNSEKLSKLLQRYESLKEDCEEEECFMYGTHYSSIGNVLYYLLRIEPFTSYNLYFNDGKYDAADRLFHCIEDTFLGCLTNSSDVKELIPEFYYLPDFLLNSENLDFGKRQSDAHNVNDVVLPKWANCSAEKFIVTMREALESEYVSQHLHDWIDLIFGYKQRGVEAQKAFNVFHPYTYAGNVVIDSIEDDIERRAILAQINEYGQTPTQLFAEKHPSRLLKKNQEILSTIFEAQRIDFYSFNNFNHSNHSIAAIAQMKGEIIVIGSDYAINIYKWNKSKLCCERPRKTHHDYSIFNIFSTTKSNAHNMNKIGGDISLKIIDAASCFAITKNAPHLAFCCGFANNSFIIWDCVHSLCVKCVFAHEEIVSCLALDEEEKGVILVTGSYDKKVIVWRVKNNEIEKKHILVNQLSAILCVDISLKSGIIACCSADGLVNVYNSSTGDHYYILQPFVDKYLRDKHHDENVSITHSLLNIVRVSHAFGFILCYSKQTRDIFLYSVANGGKIIASHSSNNDVYHDIKFSACTNYIVCGGNKSAVRIKEIPSLATKKKIKLNKNEIITKIYVEPKKQTTLFIGTDKGNIAVYSLPQRAFIDVRIGALDRHGF